MGVKEKVMQVVMSAFRDAYVRLDDDDGISGFVVSPEFKGVSSLDRQRLIDKALGAAPVPLGPEERRRVLMIAGLSPVEFESVGPRVRVHKVRKLAGGKVEVVLHGRLPDAEYVRGVFNNRKGVETTDPSDSPGAVGVLLRFEAKGPDADPLTKGKAVRLLKADPYIEVMPNA
jgi:hypothetical protein